VRDGKTKCPVADDPRHGEFNTGLGPHRCGTRKSEKESVPSLSCFGNWS